MPFAKRTVEPEFLCRNNNLANSLNVLEDQNECVWINYLKQTASISTETNEIFEDIKNNIKKIEEKYKSINDRIHSINSTIPNTKFPTSELASGEGYIQCPYQVKPQFPESSSNLQDMPAALLKLYNSCRPMPDFQIIDRYRQDNEKTSDKYSNPSLFFESWRATLELDKVDQKKKRRRRQKAIPEVSVEKKIAELPKSKQRQLAQRHELQSAAAAAEHIQPIVIPIKSSVISKKVEEKVYTLADSLPTPLDKANVIVSPLPSPSLSPDLSGATLPLPPPFFEEDSPLSSLPILEEMESSFTPPISPPASTDMPQPPSPTFGSYEIKSASISPTFVPPAPPPPPPPPPLPPPTYSSKPISALPKVENITRFAPKQDSRDQLLDSIRIGKTLRKVELADNKPVSKGYDEVYELLSQRIHACVSDSEDEEEEYDGDW
ncbi:hypothetical protein MXB_4590 [Myxobolus squamalis]|nr:hypothetical protein MXB_4590 [Myxobolus squamalis]